MKDNPIFSVIVINRNNENYIEKCLKSIYSSLSYPKEVIVIDDFSEDNSIAAIKTQPDKIIQLHKQLGIANARKVGFDSARGKYVIFIDSDIEIKNIDENKIIETFTDTKLIGIVGRYYSPPVINFNWNTILDIRRQDIQLKGSYDFTFNLRKYTTFSGGFAIFEKIKMQNLAGEGVNGLAAEDLFQQIIMSHKGYHFYYMSDFVGIHHHYRSFTGLIKKGVSEVKGELWLMNKILEKKMQIPIFDPIYTYPGLLLLSVLLKSPLPFVLNYLNYLVILVYRHKVNYFFLFIYQIFKDIYKIYWSVAGVILHKLSLVQITKFFFLGTILSIVAKFDWLVRFITKEKITITSN